MFLSLTRLHSQMCIRIYIFNLKKQRNEQKKEEHKKSKNAKKAKKLKKKREYLRKID